MSDQHDNQLFTVAYLSAQWGLSYQVVAEAFAAVQAEPTLILNGVAYYDANTAHGEVFCYLGNRGAFENHMVRWAAPVEFDGVQS